MRTSHFKDFLLSNIIVAICAMPASAISVTESQKLTSSPSSTGAFFGRSSAISGNTAIVGAFEEGGGAAYIFERDMTGIWSQVSRLTAYGPNPGDGFGFSVAIDGDRALVGGRGVGFTGGAWSFQRNSIGQWTPAGKLPAVGLASGDFFGVDVALSGDVASVGANHDREIKGAFWFLKKSRMPPFSLPALGWFSMRSRRNKIDACPASSPEFNSQME